MRDATATVESIPLIAASIMSKKLAEGIDGLVLDVKTGSGAFLNDLDDSVQLAETMCDVGHKMGKKIVALIKDSKKKAQASIQGDTVRIASKDRDVLQEVIALLRGKDLGIDLQFTNYRSN